MSLFPRLINNDFAPMFRLMEDYADHVSSRTPSNGLGQHLSSSYRSFVPKFNVKEETDRYVLEGELPGISQKDVNIEFTDSNTLSIKGRTETVREGGTRPQPSPETASTPSVAAAESETKSKQPSVEDEAFEVVTSEGSTVESSTVESSSVEQSKPETPAPALAPKSKYWVSERSVGEFARTFSFPSRVDHDSVKASMRDGILSIVVPKVPAPANRRIAIE